MSQEDLAEAADVHPTWISRLENGGVNPSWGTVRRIALALGVSVAVIAEQAERRGG
jgi:transcriptional regulator with XRE-family HTH domain